MIFMNPDDFWRPFEDTADSFAKASELIFNITERDPEKQYAWRGVPDAGWALQSSLYRRLLWSKQPGQDAPDEKEFAAAEKRVIDSAQKWGLHSGDRGRLSMFEFLATLQHYGAPTRLIDVTFNPYVALFFATERAEDDSKDGRIFAVEVTGRLLNGNEDSLLAGWEQLEDVPWNNPAVMPAEHWGHVSYVWKPAGFDRRIAAQHGAFLLGGVPAAWPGAWPTSTTSGAKWKIDDVRRATSVPVRPHVINRTAGRPPKDGSAVYSFRITSSAKQAIRQTLLRTFALDHATIYPDFPGYAAFGVDWLPTKPSGLPAAPSRTTAAGGATTPTP